MKLRYLICAFLISASLSAYGWGQTGHRVSGAIAEQHLSAEARQAIEAILPKESLAEAATYADEMRSNPSVFWRKTASPWHYVTVPVGKSYGPAPEQGDAITALKAFKKTLLDDEASLSEKQLALRFTVHIIGDLHQPLHAGNGTDRGGNTAKVEFFGEPTNLHRLWDTQLIDGKKLSYTEWTKWLSEKLSAEQVASWQQPDPKIWIAESAELRDKIYPERNDLSYDYIYTHMPTVKQRLQQAGIRMAAYLNDLYR